MSDHDERSPSITLETARTATDWHAARLLVLDLTSWMDEHAGLEQASTRRSAADESIDLPLTYSPPHGRFLLARLDGVAVGCVALRNRGGGVAELERLYVRPGARGLSLGDRLLRRILELAAWDRLRLVQLEIGAGNPDPAIGITRRHGFMERPTIGASTALPVTMERHLLRTPTPG